MSGKEEVYKSFVDFIGEHYISTGPAKGGFQAAWAQLPGSTATAIFVISWQNSKLTGK